MKVIKRGKPQNTYEDTCDECETVVEVERCDLRFVADFRDGDAYVYVCPECHREQWIAADLLPRGMKP